MRVEVSEKIELFNFLERPLVLQFSLGNALFFVWPSSASAVWLVHQFLKIGCKFFRTSHIRQI